MIRYIFRVCWAALQGFMKDDCFNKASGLTFYTLLSIVPILAVAFGIANSIGFEKYLEREVTARLLDQPELAHRITSFAYSVLERTHGGAIALAGVIGLLWTSMGLLGNIEYSLNVIWNVAKPRSYARQFRDYLYVLILCSIFFVISSSFSVLTIAEIDRVSQQSHLIKSISPFLFFAIGFTPFLINWILFSFIYIYMPNTKVQWKSAIIAGLIAGVVYQIVQWVYIHFQIGVANYGAIYGSFAALPLFLVWMNTSWIVTLGGAELARHLELIPRISRKDRYEWIDEHTLGLWIAAYCAKEFMKGQPPIPIQKLANESGASISTIHHIAYQLHHEGILAVNDQNCFLMAKEPADIKIKDVLDALEKEFIATFPVKASPQFHEYNQSIKELELSLASSPSNKSLKDLGA
jgi:membrane protein